MAREREISGYRSFRVTVAPGLTLFTYFDAGGLAGALDVTVKPLSGGSLFMFGSSQTSVPGAGPSLSTAAAFTLSASSWYVSELIKLEGPARFYFQATGATAIANVGVGISQGN